MSVASSTINTTTQQPAQHVSSERFKPSIMPITALEIGQWTRKAMFLGDIFCKFYYKKKQLVWELMCEDSLGYLYKIVINFADVMKIDFRIPADQSTIMMVELLKPPSFFKEVNPQPATNIQWTTHADFTGGQASSTANKHVLHFSKNTLTKHLSKLLADDTLQKVIVTSNLPASAIQPLPMTFMEEGADDDEEDD